jgi:hypothetical protein
LFDPDSVWAVVLFAILLIPLYVQLWRIADTDGEDMVDDKERTWWGRHFEGVLGCGLVLVLLIPLCLFFVT